MNNEHKHDDVQHGIDDSPNHDAGKGAALGGVGGAIVGGLAGGPVGAVIGAVAGAAASGVGVAAVDQVDNDNTVTGVGDGDEEVHRTDENMDGVPMNERTVGYDSAVADPKDYPNETQDTDATVWSNNNNTNTMGLPTVRSDQ